eukprot:SAG11_NODE_3601_length_2340_cov_8.286732_2_plen_92_part_00
MGFLGSSPSLSNMARNVVRPVCDPPLLSPVTASREERAIMHEGRRLFAAMQIQRFGRGAVTRRAPPPVSGRTAPVPRSSTGRVLLSRLKGT